ncbi:MAG: hypothetical protein ABSC47_08990 [Terracidiphilus sp.]|jgi:hypothetical protein
MTIDQLAKLITIYFVVLMGEIGLVGYLLIDAVLHFMIGKKGASK